MKNIITLGVTLCIIGLLSCEKQKVQYPDIKIGKEQAMEALSLNKETERKIIVSGGNGKYIVNVEDSKIATAQIVKDTLKVRGLLEGETFATILSHDKQGKLKITVSFAKLGVSHTEIQLIPGIKNKVISISGGGELTKLEEKDPEDIMDIKWDAATRMLEINPKYEGEAEVIAISEDGIDKQSIKIKVKPEGEIKMPGCYGTNASSYYLAANNKMVVERKGVGTLIVNEVNPYGGEQIKIAPIVNPVQKEFMEVTIISANYKKPKIEAGTVRLYVEEVRDGEVMLRGKGFKFLLPYRK